MIAITGAPKNPTQVVPEVRPPQVTDQMMQYGRLVDELGQIVKELESRISSVLNTQGGAKVAEVPSKPTCYVPLANALAERNTSLSLLIEEIKMMITEIEL